MNSYAYSGMDQPAAPPRRKRSLSTSRSDYASQDPVGMAFQSNRIGRRNFSTDHIPGGYAYSGISKSIGSGYNSGSQQALSGSSNYSNGGYNALQNYNTRQPFQQIQHSSYTPNQLSSINYSSKMSPQYAQQAQQFMQNPHQHRSPQLQQQQQQHQQQTQQNYNSFGSNLNNFGRATAPEQPMPIPRFMNPYAVPSSKVTPVRAHQDYLKYAQPNVHYNPYQSQFSPTLMARPDIHPAVKPEQVPTFQKRDRSPYSSREQLDLNQNPVSPFGPQRPPPPKSQNTTRLSVENLSTPTASDYEAHLSSQLRDRRSVSPTRFSPGTQMLQNQQSQRPYGTNRHSTSPLPSPNGIITSQDRYSENRYGSRSSLNSPTSGYVSQRVASSREGSPFTRPVSPFGRPSSPFSTSTSFGLDSSSLGLSSRARSYSSNTSGLQKLDRSVSYLGSSTSTGLQSNRYDRSISVGSSSDRSNITGFSIKSSDSTDLQHEKLTKANDISSSNNSNNQTQTLSSLQNSTQNTQQTHQMDSLQVPGTNDSSTGMLTSLQNNHQNRTNPQFSEAFTDHCDQYKSVTSKILSRNNKNRNSGEFGDVFNELSQHLSSQEQLSSNGYDEFNYERTSSERAMTPEPKADPYLEEKKILENQLFNSPSVSRVTSRNNSLAFDNFGSPTSSRKNSNTNDLFTKNTSPQTSRRNSASAATSSSRKGSLPSDYLAHPDTFALSNEWSRERVANLAHEARQRAHNPPGNDALKKIGVWFTKQFVFLLIAGVNIAIAYAFYNLFAMLPADI